MSQKLNPEDLQVTTFATGTSAATAYQPCCTGCDSGCGIFPTAGGCESVGGDTEYASCGGTCNDCM